MAFYENRYLIMAGVQGESTIAIWNLQTRVIEKSAEKSWSHGHYAINQVRVDPFVGSSFIQFVTVGNNAAFTVWRYDIENQQVALFDVGAPELSDVHFLSVTFSDFLQAPPSNRSESQSATYYAVVGTSEGTVVPFDLTTHEFTERNMINKITQGEIGVISIANNSVVVGSSDGTVAHYPILGGQISPQGNETVVKQQVESAVVSITLDELNEQGLIGTEAGCIHYINFLDDTPPIKLVSSNNMNQDAITCLKFDFANPRIFVASCGHRTEQLKLGIGENCDEVWNFPSNFEEYGHVVFVVGRPKIKDPGPVGGQS